MVQEESKDGSNHPLPHGCVSWSLVVVVEVDHCGFVHNTIADPQWREMEMLLLLLFGWDGDGLR